MLPRNFDILILCQLSNKTPAPFVCSLIALTFLFKIYLQPHNSTNDCCSRSGSRNGACSTTEGPPLVSSHPPAQHESHPELGTWYTPSWPLPACVYHLQHTSFLKGQGAHRLRPRCLTAVFHELTSPGVPSGQSPVHGGRAQWPNRPGASEA